MTPIPFTLPAGRILPPTVAYAAGLVCEHRPDLADAVRAAVMGDAVVVDLDALALNCAQRQDEKGSLICDRLREVAHYAGDAPKALHGLADVLGMILSPVRGLTIVTPDNERRDGCSTIGDIWWRPGHHRQITGLPYRSTWYKTLSEAQDAARLLLRSISDGFVLAWESAALPGERKALRCLIPIYAHTVSLDADTRAAWAKAHLDALTPSIRPQSPDRLT